MLIKMPLKNAPDQNVILDSKGYDLLVKMNLIEFGQDAIFRLHSAGYAVHQKWSGDTCHTVYLHKFIANQFLVKPETSKRLFVRMLNGNKLDCRIENLEWVTMSMLRRQMKTKHNQTGYRGVTKDRGYYRSVINIDGKRINLGTFKTAEEAALAYNEKSRELFGETKSLNQLQGE